MLAVDQRPCIERLADLEQLAIPVLAERRGVQAEHQVELQRATGGAALRHAHPPVLRREFGAAPRPALVVQVHEHHAVLHEVPAGERTGSVSCMCSGIVCAAARAGEGEEQEKQAAMDAARDGVDTGTVRTISASVRLLTVGRSRRLGVHATILPVPSGDLVQRVSSLMGQA